MKDFQGWLKSLAKRYNGASGLARAVSLHAKRTVWPQQVRRWLKGKGITTRNLEMLRGFVGRKR